jgi:hypothetical protein
MQMEYGERVRYRMWCSRFSRGCESGVFPCGWSLPPKQKIRRIKRGKKRVGGVDRYREKVAGLVASGRIEAFRARCRDNATRHLRRKGVLPREDHLTALTLKIWAKKAYEYDYKQEARASKLHDSWWSGYANGLPVHGLERNELVERYPLIFAWLLAGVQLARKRDAKRRSKRALRRSPHTRSYIVERVRKRMAKAIKEGKGMKSGTSRNIIGCDWGALRAHLEAGFTERMSWSNYGQYGWHIDHIEPLARFDMRDPAQVRKAWHYTNLQPLWWTDNLAKLDSFEFERVPGGCVQTLTN